MSRRLSFIACILVAAFTVAPVAEARIDRIVLKRRAGLSAAERADVRADADVTLERTLGIAGVEVVVADDGDRARAVSELRADPDVVWAEPDRRARRGRRPAGRARVGARQQRPERLGRRGTLDADIDAPEAWAITRGAGATVAVVDSGVTRPIPTSQPGCSPATTGSATTTSRRTLTATARTWPARSPRLENGVGAVGVAPAAGVIPLRVLGRRRLRLALRRRGRLRLGRRPGVRIIKPARRPRGLQRGAAGDPRSPRTLYVVAAGNLAGNVDGTPLYPCTYTEANILCVGATDSSDEIASFSNYGANAVDLFAPGVDIASTYPMGLGSYLDDGFEVMNGTSMATPHVAGAAALVAAHHPDFTAGQIKAALMEGADLRPGLAGKARVGGRLNAAAALGGDPPAPTPTPPRRRRATPRRRSPAPAAVGSLRVSGNVVVGRRPRTATLSFTALAATNVTVTLRRQGRARQTTAAVSRGGSRWRISRTVAGLRLRPGRYQLTLTAPAGPASAKFSVRAR